MHRLPAFALALAVAALPFAAAAQDAYGACGDPAPAPQSRRSSPLGGLLAAARQSGLAEALGGPGGNSEIAAVAGAVLSGGQGASASGYPMDDGYSAGGYPAGGGDSRTSRLAGAAVGMARQLAAQGGAGRSGGCPSAEPSAGGEAWR